MDHLHHFIQSCKKLQPQSQQDIKHFFESVVFFPYDNELLLQAFLFLNVHDYFPDCKDLLLFEKSPQGDQNTDLGKCDFVFSTMNKRIVLIETKFIDTENTGKTQITKRKNHRKKVFQQVSDLREKFSQRWSIPIGIFDCCVFTTEDLSHREEAKNIQTKHISIGNLKQWQKNMKIFLQLSIDDSN